MDNLNGASDTFSSLLAQFNDSLLDVLTTWEGDSSLHYEDICTSFIEETKKVRTQFESYSTAVDLCKQYEEELAASDRARNAYYNLADTEENRSMRNQYARECNAHVATAKEIKPKILAALETISEIVVEGSKGMTSISYASDTIAAAIEWALATAADDSHGYSQQTRWGNPNYDCSSFVISAYQNAGTGVKDAGAGYTGNMRSAFTNSGFAWIPYSQINSMDDLQPGDVLLDEDQHTEMYIGNGQNVGAHSNHDGYDGDSGGKEVSVTNYYRGTWDGVLRYVGNDGNDKKEGEN